MAEWKRIHHRRFWKAIEALERSGESSVVNRILAATVRLSQDPFTHRPDLDVCKLEGARDLFRLRVGKYRIVYALDAQDQTIRFLALMTREQAYR